MTPTFLHSVATPPCPSDNEQWREIREIARSKLQLHHAQVITYQFELNSENPYGLQLHHAQAITVQIAGIITKIFQLQLHHAQAITDLGLDFLSAEKGVATPPCPSDNKPKDQLSA